MNPVSSIQSHVWNVQYNITNTKLTSDGCISFATHLAKACVLVALLEDLSSTRKKHQRGEKEAQSFLSHIYLRAMKEGHLSDLDDVRQDLVFQVLTGLSEISGSCRMGEFLCRFPAIRMMFIRSRLSSVKLSGLLEPSRKKCSWTVAIAVSA